MIPESRSPHVDGFKEGPRTKLFPFHVFVRKIFQKDRVVVGHRNRCAVQKRLFCGTHLIGGSRLGPDFCNVFSVSVSIDVRLEWRIQDFQSGKGTSLKEDAIFFSPNFPENIISICGRGRPLQPNHRAYGKCELSLTLSTLRTHNKCRSIREVELVLQLHLHKKQRHNA